MPKKLFFISLALLTLHPGALVPTFAQDSRLTIKSVSTKNKRRVLNIEVIGSSSLPNGTSIDLSFGKKSNRAFSEQALIEKGAFKTVIALRGLVLPGQYDLQARLSKKQKPWIEKKLRALNIDSASAQKAFRIGQAADEAKAQKRMKAWVLRANSALRSLALTLETRAVWHWNILKSSQDPTLRSKQISAFQSALESFEAGSKVAAMDLALYRRRLVFDPFPAASSELRALIDLANNRSKQHLAMLQAMANGQSRPCPSLSPYLALQKRLAKAVQEAEDSLLKTWVLGPNSSPEKGSVAEKDGQRIYQSQNGGFAVKVPKNWTAEAARDQGGLRLVMRAQSGGNAKVQIAILPGSNSDVQTMTGIAGWESWQSYQRISLTKLTGAQNGARHEFRATIQSGQNAVAIRVLELRLKRKDGRTLQLVAFTTIKDYAAQKAVFEDIAGSVTVP